MSGWQYPNNVRQVFGYNALNRLTNVLALAGAFTVGQFDYQTAAAGNRTALDEAIHTDFNQFQTRMDFDSMGRLARKQPISLTGRPESRIPVEFTYTATGQRRKMTDAGGTTWYFYDDFNRLRVKAAPQGHLTYDYDDSGNLTRTRSTLRYPIDADGNITDSPDSHTFRSTGVDVFYAWDNLNRLSKVISGTGEETIYVYEANDLKEVHYPNGITSVHHYNERRHLDLRRIPFRAEYELDSVMTTRPGRSRRRVCASGPMNRFTSRAPNWRSIAWSTLNTTNWTG